MKRIQLFEQYIFENSFKIYDKIMRDEELSTFLGFLIHDKKHVLDNKSTSSELEKIFKMVKGKNLNQPLYRGLYDEKIEEFVIGESYNFLRYQSFSENIETAQRFSKNGLILKANTSVNGFNYGKYTEYSLKSLKKENPDLYLDIDGEFYIEFAIKEAEWLFPRTSKFIVENINNQGSYTIISGKIV